MRRTSRGTPGGLLMYRIGSPAVRKRTPACSPGRKAARPQPGRDRLHLLGVRRPGDHHDERRQVVVERAQAVRRPRAEARPAGDLVAGLHERDRRLVVDRLGVHAADEAQVVDHLRRPRQQLADPHAALAVLLELVLRRRDREAGLAAGHRREPLAHADRVGQVLVVPLVHHRLVVEQVHLRRPADHVQIDDVLRLRREVRAAQRRAPASRPALRASALPRQRRQRRRAQQVRARGQEMPPRDVQSKFVEWVHGIVRVSFAT